jgi:multiple sugar transport system substrate-binding protein
MPRFVMVACIALLAITPLGARGVDLVVWWEKGYYAQENEAVGEIIAAFEHKTGKQVELVFYSSEDLANALQAGLSAGQPPDFLFVGTG